MLSIILFSATLVVVVVLVIVLMATDEINGLTGLIWIGCILMLLTPGIAEYADTNGSVIRYSRDGKLLAKTEYGLFCIQRCANVPDTIELDEVTLLTNTTVSALGPLKIKWQLTVKVKDWQHFAGIFATAKKPARLYDINTIPPLKQIIVDVLNQPQLEVERALHLAVGFGNTTAAGLGTVITATLKPVLDQYGLEVVTITTAATLR